MRAGIIDFILLPIYLMLGWIFFKNYSNKRIRAGFTYYRFLPTLFIIKALLGTLYCIIYTYYYTYGGDSVGYFTSSVVLSRAFFTFGPFAFLEIIGSIITKDPYIPYLNEDTGYFNIFSLSDTNAIFTSFYTVPFTILGFNNYILATIVLNIFSTMALWKLFQVLHHYYSHRFTKMFSFIYFFPSLLFWGSGILKDNYCLSFLAIYVYSFFKLYILKQKKIKYYLGFFLSIPIILTMKPYIVLSIIPGSVLWFNFEKIKRIKSTAGKFLFLPVSILLFGSILIFGYLSLSEYLGEYSYDKILDKAVKTQRDLIRAEAYGQNYFDIGEFDATFSGIMSKFFPAVNAVLFRPYIWESRNVMMIFSGLENLLILLISLFLVFKIKFKIIVFILQNPLLFFSFTFALFFGFTVGLTTSNFGALVRLKIPAIAFYLLSLVMLYTDYLDEKQKKLFN